MLAAHRVIELFLLEKTTFKELKEWKGKGGVSLENLEDGNVL